MQHPFAQEIVAVREHVEEPVELPAEGFAMRPFAARFGGAFLA
jgi:hypothetical protein